MQMNILTNKQLQHKHSRNTGGTFFDSRFGWGSDEKS